MLASTMQFSSYERNPPPNPTPTPTPTRSKGAHKDTKAVRRDDSPRETPRPPAPHNPHGCTEPAPVPSGPNSVPSRPPPHQRVPPPTTPKGQRESTSTSRTETGQLIDVPPMSNHPGTLVRAVALDPTP